MQIYELSVTKFETTERSINKYTKNRREYQTPNKCRNKQFIIEAKTSDIDTSCRI